MITGYWISQGVYVAAKLELADHIARGTRTVGELAALTKSNADALFRLLRALAGIGVFAETETQTFENTPLSELLRRDVPDSQWAMAVMMCEEHYVTWGDLLHSVRTGEGAFRKQYGLPVFEYLAQRPEQAHLFDAAMTSIHGRETAAMLAAFDFSQFKHVMDIGGGNGSMLSQVLLKFPSVHGTVVDLPHVVERAAQSHANSPLKERLSFHGGNFFESVPGGADAYLLRHIIHDWDDARSTTILRNIAAAMPEHAQVILLESVIPPGNEWMFGKWLDLTMLLIPEGRERTEDEYRALLAAAGLTLTEIIPTEGEISILVARK